MRIEIAVAQFTTELAELKELDRLAILLLISSNFLYSMIGFLKIFNPQNSAQNDDWTLVLIPFVGACANLLICAVLITKGLSGWAILLSVLTNVLLFCHESITPSSK